MNSGWSELGSNLLAEMDFPMASTTKGDEVFFHVTSQLASLLFVMDLQILGTAALLAAPAIALKHSLAKCLIGIRG
jgi:hypothetical protein